MKNNIKNIRIAFGFIYFIFNVIFLTVFTILEVYWLIEKDGDPGAIMLVFPILGLFAGSWIRHGRFGWWRVSLIVISLLCSAAAIYLGFFMSAVLNKF
ncbi:MAG TPA: hypothetical protein VI749_00775 [Candidatus Omnitrophota bacterium]|nr:hypothetical protein [Candidatus Omnitrophota bacterium]